MNEKELQEILAQLKGCGVDAQLCNTPIPLSNNPVHCGLPADVGDVAIEDYVMLPKSLVGIYPEIFIPAIGDSMKDAGYEEGDRLRVRLGQLAQDGDNVLASIDNECTVKTLFHDDRGAAWLVPQNAEYDALQLSGLDNFQLLGVVVGVEKRTPRSSWTECARKVNQTKRKVEAAQKLEDWQVDVAIKTIGANVAHARQWYAVYRAMLDCHVMDENTYAVFCERVATLLPDHDHLPSPRELQRMAVLSFAKPIALWNERNAPVSGVRFRDYLAVARTMINLLSDKKLGFNKESLPF